MWLHVPQRALRACSAAAECSTPESTWPAELSLWCTSSGEHSPRPSSWPGWRARPWVRLLCGTTSLPSTLARGVAWWIASLAEVPVKTSPSPVDALGSLAREAGSGSTSSASLTRQGLLFSSGKTSEAQSEPRWTWLRTTLESSATELRLALSALRMSVPHTSGSDSSSWPTPSAKPYGSNQSPSPGAALRPSPGAALRPSLQSLSAQWPTPTATDRKASGAADYSTESGRHSGTTLTDAAIRQWPTPSARDWKGAPDEAHDRGTRGAPLNEVAKLWATPCRPLGGRSLTAEQVEAKGAMPNGKKRQVDLRAQARLWATPTASDGRKGTGESATREGSPSLSTMARTSSPPHESPDSGPTGMALNPEFVEALMGLPPRWSLPLTALSSSETESSPSKRRRRSSSAGSGSSGRNMTETTQTTPGRELAGRRHAP